MWVVGTLHGSVRSSSAHHAVRAGKLTDMSYGVIASRSVRLRVETASAAPGSESDVVLERFASIWGSGWVAGRLTLTRLHVTFVPARAGRGSTMLEMSPADLDDVVASGGRLLTVVTLSTKGHRVHVRSLGARGLAEQIASLAAAARQPPSES